MGSRPVSLVSMSPMTIEEQSIAPFRLIVIEMEQ